MIHDHVDETRKDDHARMCDDENHARMCDEEEETAREEEEAEAEEAAGCHQKTRTPHGDVGKKKHRGLPGGHNSGRALDVVCWSPFCFFVLNINERTK